MKTCTKCGETKGLDCFAKNSRNKTDGRQPKCKECNKKYRQQNRERIVEYLKDYYNVKGKYIDRTEYRKWYSRNNRDKINSTKRLYRENNKGNLWEDRNPDKAKKARQKWVRNNRDRRNKSSEKYRKNNKGLYAFYARTRHAAKLKATPNWLTAEQLESIKDMYILSSKIGDLTGQPMEVDHIVPLQGENVCGLHVPWNLQVLHRIKNRSKGNRYDE